MKKSIAFTLAEIMIVLVVIGVLSAVLIPTARNSMPDENVMKFKKAHNAFATAIRELVNSDEYFLDGKFNTKPDGSAPNETYFCNALIDVLNTKEYVCNEGLNGLRASFIGDHNKTDADGLCGNYQVNAAAGNNLSHIVLSDGAEIYFLSPIFNDEKNADGFYKNCSYMCIDIDGLNSGEDPFGYCVRTDGKIINGARADEWLNKSIHGDE